MAKPGPGAPLLAGLSPTQEERAARLHEESIVFDLHDHMWRPQDFEDMRKGGITAKTYKPFADGLYWDEKNRRMFPSNPVDWTAKYLARVAQVEQIEKSGVAPVLIIRRLEDFVTAKRE